MDRENAQELLRLHPHHRPRGVLYVGVTNNVSRRTSEHRAKIVPGFTSRHGVIMLVHVGNIHPSSKRGTREHSLKRWRREWKFELIEKNNPDWHDRSGDLSF